MCQFGFAANDNGNCSKCLGACSKCDPAELDVCTGCARGFELNGTRCERCPEGCLKCKRG